MKFCINCMAKIRDTKEICPYCGQRQDEGVKSAFHLSPGITLGTGRYLVGKALRWDSFSVTYSGKNLLDGEIVTIQEYVPEMIAKRQSNMPMLACIAGEEREYQNGLESFMETAGLMAEKRQSLVHVAAVKECFRENGTGYIISEHLNGQTVQELLEKGHIFTWDSARQVVDAVLEGLASLHRIDIIHQDLFPENVFLTAEGEIKVSSPGGYRYQVIGNKVQRSSAVRNGYSAQEQYQSTGNIGAFTDVYGAGALMYHMVTGTRPKSAADRMYGEQLELPQKVADDMPRYVQNALMNSLLLEPDRRTQTPELFRKEMGNKNTKRIVSKKKPVKKEGKKTVVIAAVAAVALCLLGTVAYKLISSAPEEHEMVEVGSVPNITNMSENEAQKQAEKYHMTIRVEDVLPSEVDKGNVISQTPAAGERADENEIIQVVLSGGSEEVQVPNVLGLAKEDAVEKLKNRKLKGVKAENIRGIYTSGEDSKKYPEGCIVSESVNGQDIRETDEASCIVAQETTELLLKYSLGDYDEKVPEMKIPDLKAVTLEEAEKSLEEFAEDEEGRMTFKLEELKTEYNFDVPEGAIIHQNPEAGESRRPYSIDNIQNSIQVTVSLGRQPVELPDVSGKSVEEAQKLLEGEKYRFEVEKEGKYSSTVEKGCVIKTETAGGTSMRQGDTVTVVYSMGPEPDPTPVPKPKVPNKVPSSKPEKPPVPETNSETGFDM